MFCFQFTQAFNDDRSTSSSFENNLDHPLYRRNSKQVAQMLQQMLHQNSEKQVEYILEYIYRGKTNHYCNAVCIFFSNT